MFREDDSSPYEILEHTADIGVRARGQSLEETFENACRGLLEILGASAETGGAGEDTVSLEAADREALLVALADELIYRTETRSEGVVGVKVRLDSPRALRVTIEWGPRRPSPEGIELKAATYHQLSIRRSDGGWEAAVYFDV